MMRYRRPWYVGLSDNPVVVMIGTLSALVTIVAYVAGNQAGTPDTPPPPISEESAAPDDEPDAPPARQPVGTVGPEQPAPAPQPAPETAAGLALEIRRPYEGQLVDQFTDLEYAVHGAIPDGYAAVAFVRDPLGQYWSFGPAAQGMAKRVQIGVKDGQRLPFEIGVWITKEDVPRGEPYNDPPRALRSASVRVVRR
jgi:hypothetical protein